MSLLFQSNFKLCKQLQALVIGLDGIDEDLKLAPLDELDGASNLNQSIWVSLIPPAQGFSQRVFLMSSYFTSLSDLMFTRVLPVFTDHIFQQMMSH